MVPIQTSDMGKAKRVVESSIPGIIIQGLLTMQWSGHTIHCFLLLSHVTNPDSALD